MSLDPFDPLHFGGVQFARPAVYSLKDVLQSIREQWGLDESARGLRYANRAGCATCGPGKPYTAREAPQGPFVLPLPPTRPALRMEVHTLRFGNPPWLAECAPTLDAWCSRHGLPLHITTEWDNAYPHGKFAFVDMLRQFVEGESDWMMFFDADVVFHPLAPRPHFDAPGFYSRFDQPISTNPKHVKAWRGWCEQHFSALPPDAWIYRNTGVWACDRDSAIRLLAEVSLPFISGTLEQNQMNWWMIQAERNGMVAAHLPESWNRTVDDLSPAWAFHIYGKNKHDRLIKFRAAGLLPDPVKPLDGLPPLIDFGKGAVVWPYKASAAQWDELWFSHRSVIEHWSEKDWPLVLLGDECPPWWPGKFIHASRYEDALWLGTQCADQVLWMNDDIFMLADQSWEDYARAPMMQEMRTKLGETMVAQNSWRRGLGQVLMRLHHHGKSTLNFSTHTPYLYDRAKVREIFDRFGIFYKIPFETAYHNWYDTSWKSVVEKAKGPHDLAGKLWINPSFSQATREFRAELAARFGAPPSAHV